MAGPALGVTISGKGIKETTSDLDAFRKSAAEAEKAADGASKADTGLAKATRDVAKAAKEATPALTSEAAATARVDRANRTTTGSMERLAGAIFGAKNGINAMTVAMVTAGTRMLSVAGIASSISGYIRLGDAWSDMQSKVGAAVKDMQAAPDLMERMVDIANASYSPLTQTVEVYARNVGVLRDLGKTASETADFTEALNNALVITATRGERAASVQDALSKAMAVGRLQADGLETILANGGRVAEALAAELNTNVNGLRAFASQGKITGAVIVNSLLNSFEALRDEAAEMPATVADGLTRIGTGITALIGFFDQATGSTGALAGALVSIGDAVAAMATWVKNNGELVATVFNTVIGTAISAATAAAIYYATIMAGRVASSIMAASAAAAANAIAMGHTTTATILATTATAALSRAMVVLRTAIISTGLGAIAVAAGYLVGKFLELVSSAGGFGRALGLLKDVAVEVFGRIQDAFGLIPLAAKAGSASMKQWFLGALQDMLQAFQDLTWKIADGLNGLFGSNLRGADFSDTLWDIGGSLREATHEAGDATAALAELSASLTAPLTSLDALRAVADEASDSLAGGGGGGGASGAGGLAGAAGKASESAKELERRLDAVNDALSAARTPMQKFQDGLAELNQVAGYAKDAGIDFTQAYAHGMAELNDELLAAYPSATKFVDIMTDGLFDGFKNTLSNLRDMFRSWLKEMIATALKNQIVVPILTAMAGGGAGVAAGAAGSAGMFGAMGTGAGLAGLAGGTGFLGGVGNAIGGNMFAVGANAAAAGGGVMATIGAAAVPILAVAAAVSFLKKSTKELDSGMRVTVQGVDAMAESFRKVQTSRFWGLSKKTKTTYDGVADETQAAISAAVANMQGGIMDMAHVLGVGASAFDDFAHVLTISTKGMTQDQALAEIQGKLAELGDSFAGMIPGLDAQIRYGETATEALTRLSSSLVAVRDVADLLGHSFKAAGIAGGALASSLADAFGGIDAMTGAVNAYFSAFYTEQEQIETATRRATAALASLGVAMPKTRAEYRAMIDALDLTNAASHATYAALISLSGVMDQILPSVANLTAELAQLQGGVSTGLDAAITAANAAAKANADAASNWYKASGSIRDWINKMRGTVSPLNSPAQARAANEAQYQIILARALAGDLDAARDVTGAADRLLASVSATARSQSEAAIVEARILADLTKLSVSSDIEGARHDIISGLLRRQVDMMTTLRDYLAAGNALTVDMIDSFNKGMTDLDKGIAAAGKITYDSVSKTVPRILDLAGDTSAILSAVIGKDGKLQVGPITLGKMDAFSTWYESTTKAAVATPMADLRNAMTPLRTSLDALRTALVAEGQRQAAAAKADADRQAKAAADAKKLANAEAKLANLASQRTSAVANLTKAANAINAFDEKTGGYLVNAQGKQEYATVNAKGQLEYAPTGVRNASSSALKQWQATYWADGGLEDQLLKANGAVLAVDRQLEAARAAIRALGGVPSFAGGGSTGNAPRTGGVDGMGGFPAILHPQEVVVDRTSDVFAELKDEIVRLRKEVQEFKEQSRQIDMGIYDNGRKVANRINKWDVDGLPPERTPA